jgi:hypothetical protein
MKTCGGSGGRNHSRGRHILINIQAYLIGTIFASSILLKNTLFWDVTPCSLLKISRHFGGKYSLNLQG